ncbi:MAG: hypothetical protein M1826_006913 [Phylliscum demangeonii]|nr:MAG: hypothetical protein M1826_006913 [Phylliscum demangeonii]
MYFTTTTTTTTTTTGLLIATIASTFFALTSLTSASPTAAPAAPPPPPPLNPSAAAALREAYFPGGFVWDIDLDLPNLAGRPWVSARFWRLFFAKYPWRRPALGATVDECTRNYYQLVAGLGDGERRRMHSYRSQCEDWHGVARCDKACVRAGLKGKRTYWARAAAGREVRRAAEGLRRAMVGGKRPAAAAAAVPEAEKAAAAGRSGLMLERRWGVE